MQDENAKKIGSHAFSQTVVVRTKNHRSTDKTTIVYHRLLVLLYCMQNIVTGKHELMQI